MPRYFFHLRDGKHLLRDAEGVDLLDLEAARTEALLLAREILSEEQRAHIAIEIWTEFEPLALVELNAENGLGGATIH